MKKKTFFSVLIGVALFGMTLTSCVTQSINPPSGDGTNQNGEMPNNDNSNDDTNGNPEDPSDPVDPTTPTTPTDPTEPTDPVTPTDPVDPVTPTDPSDPTDPTTPTDPVDPVTPTDPSDPTDPTTPTDPVDPVDPEPDPVTPTDPADPVDPVDPEPDPVTPTDPIPVYSISSKIVNSFIGDDVEDFTINFFSDMPNVPYVEVSSYLSRFYNKTVSSSFEEGVSIYTLGDDYLKLDIDNDKIIISDIGAFALITDYDYKFSYYVTPIEEGTDIKKADSIFDLGKYEIDIREDSDVAYVPLTSLSDCLSYVNGCTVTYNGQDVYFLDGFDSFGIGASGYENYYEILNSDTEREPDLIEYAYKELCFSIEQVNGHPAQCLISGEDIDAIGLDGVLERDFPEVKEMLLSNDRDVYYNGYAILFFYLLYDGGHGGILYNQRQFNHAGFNSLLEQNQVLNELVERRNESYTNKIDAYYGYKAARESAFGISQNWIYYYNYDFPTEDGIMYIGFDQFTINFDEWNPYYQNNDPFPTNDVLAFIYGALELAKEQNIKNVVFDVTTNGGGDTYVLQALVSLITQSNSQFRYHNTINGTDNVENYAFDSNFDGEYNELDYQNGFDFNYAVLTSYYSFSCGNAFPMELKDSGIMIIGQPSGGGSCCVGVLATAEGIPYRTSATWMLVDKNFVEHDFGVAVDQEISMLDSFNMTLVLEYMSAFYGSNN